MMAAAAALAGMQIGQGFAASREAKFNAKLYEQQAGAIDVKKRLQLRQDERAKRRMAGTLTSRVAKSGIQLSGSPLAVLLDNLTEMELDQQIGQYNLEVQKQYSLSAADRYRRQGRASVMSGFTNAFSTMLMSGFDYGSRTPKLTPTGGRFGGGVGGGSAMATYP